ncbi:MAG: hypothetical protein ABSA76_12500 [Bacteroidales bacterium]
MECGNVTEVKSGPSFNKVNDSRLLAVMRRDRALAEFAVKSIKAGRTGVSAARTSWVIDEAVKEYYKGKNKLS